MNKFKKYGALAAGCSAFTIVGFNLGYKYPALEYLGFAFCMGGISFSLLAAKNFVSLKKVNTRK